MATRYKIIHSGKKLSDLSATTSAELAGVISDETGSGALVFGTAPQISTIELGHASDTTIARVSAGVISVEGVTIDTVPTLARSATIYVTTDGSDANDGLTWNTAKLTIPAAITALGSTGGIIQLGAGSFGVSSSARTDASVSYSTGTWTDSHILTADVGSYVLGLNINAVKVPKILTVSNGVSFTTDIAPAGTVTSQSVIIVNPAFVLPAGITIKGIGSTFSQSDFSRTTAGTKILDSGTGITCLTRGGTGTANMELRHRIEDLSIQGNSNSTMYGIYIGNFDWFFNVKDCDLSFHGIAGLVADGNINSDSVYDTTFRGNGVVGTSARSGGIITHPFYSASSSSLNLYNCFFEDNYGWGVCDGVDMGASAVGLYNCQFNSTLATSATGSGTSVALLDHYNNVDAKSFIIGGWSESAALYDIDAYGSPTIINFTLASSAATAHLRTTTGNVQLIGCRFQNLNNASVVFGSGGNVSWYGTTLDSQGYFFSGCGFSNANVTAFGSTGSIQSKYISSDNSAGISTTVTTASLVGKTITIKDGIITAFA